MQARKLSSLDTSLTLLLELIKELGRDVSAQAERIESLRVQPAAAGELAEEEARLLRLADAQRRAFARIAHTIANNS